jgi:outer membrane lipoprotein-sorting protein
MKFALSTGLMLISVLALGQGKPFGQGKTPFPLPPILAEAMEKSRSLRFSGTRMVTSVRAGKVETHEEYITKDGGKIRIEFAKNSPFAGQIIVETGKERIHFFPDRNEIRQSPSSGRRQFDVLRMMRTARGGKPKFTVADGGVIAGIRTSNIQFQDSEGNVVGAVHIDPKSGMTLKRVLFDQSGSVLASYEFSKVAFNPAIAANAFKFSRKGAKIIRPVDDLKTNAETMGVPALGLQTSLGYQLEGVNVRNIRGNKTLVLVYLKDDTRLTLFITKAEVSGDRPKIGGRDFGSYQWSTNGVNCMLFGNLPTDKLRELSTRVTEVSR